MLLTATSPVELSERIARYLSKCAPAVSGQGGHNQTFFVACKLVNGFDLPEQDALAWLTQYNQRCEPQWTEAELIHKVKEATKVAHSKPRGHLLSGGFSKSDFKAPPNFAPVKPATPQPKPAADPCTEVENFLAGFAVSEADALERSPVQPSENWRQDAALLIHSLYQPGENVNIVTKYSMSGKKANPAGCGDTTERDALLEYLSERHPPESDAGAWLRMNPLDGQGVADANVTSYRFILLESDSVSPDLWISLMFKVPMPLAALIDSGNKSVHAWLKVDCATAEEYRETYERIQRHMEPLGVDKSNKNPSRLSRLPGVSRNIPTQGATQRLLYLNPKASGMDWEAFEAALKVESPEQKRVRELFADRIYIPGEPVADPIPVYSLQGVLCCTVGNITALFASEGVGKSAVMSAAMSAAIKPKGCSKDCLGWTAEPLGDKCIIHLDTEQSKEHRAKSMIRTALRVGLDDVPESLISVRMHGLSWLECQQLLDFTIQQALAKYPAGIHSIFIDGPGDLVPTVNDEEASNALVARLMLMAEQYQTHIVCVIHLNHGSENDSKMRGHLGSQLARKAETTLKVTVKDEVRTLFAPKTRSAPIPVGKGSRFKWSELFGMFVSEDTVDEEREKEDLQKLKDSFAQVFKEHEKSIIGYKELTAKYRLRWGVSERTAQTRISQAHRNGVLKSQMAGIYELA